MSSHQETTALVGVVQNSVRLDIAEEFGPYLNGKENGTPLKTLSPELQQLLGALITIITTNGVINEQMSSLLVLSAGATEPFARLFARLIQMETQGEEKLEAVQQQLAVLRAELTATHEAQVTLPEFDNTSPSEIIWGSRYAKFQAACQEYLKSRPSKAQTAIEYFIAMAHMILEQKLRVVPSEIPDGNDLVWDFFEIFKHLNTGTVLRSKMVPTPKVDKDTKEITYQQPHEDVEPAIEHIFFTGNFQINPNPRLFPDALRAWESTLRPAKSEQANRTLDRMDVDLKVQIYGDTFEPNVTAAISGAAVLITDPARREREVWFLRTLAHSEGMSYEILDMKLFTADLLKNWGQINEKNKNRIVVTKELVECSRILLSILHDVWFNGSKSVKRTQFKS